jgi:hypothetical protein
MKIWFNTAHSIPSLAHIPKILADAKIIEDPSRRFVAQFPGDLTQNKSRAGMKKLACGENMVQRPCRNPDGHSTTQSDVTEQRDRLCSKQEQT